MKLSRRQSVRGIVLASTLLALAGWLAPSFFSAERYRRGLEAGLERALRRPVTFGAIGFRLLPRPGLVIADAVVREDPAFGSEPFARVARIQCDLRWRSLWHSRLECSRLRLEHASFNIVCNTSGKWNVEDLLAKSGIVAPTRVGAAAPTNRPDSARALELSLDEARVNFKIGADKKVVALTGVHGQMSLDPDRRTVRLGLAGNPIRAGLSFPTPGPVELSGEWSPGQDLEGPLDAALRTRGGLLYDWVPLVTGQNPEIYGVLDADVRLTGSIHVLKVEGEGRLSQLRRWEQLPPSDSLTCKLDFRGQADRRQGRVLIESADVSFAGSRIHLAGSLDKIPASPELDLVVAVERSRMEDLLALGRRLGFPAGALGISGRVDGLLTIQGPWTEQRYGGFLGARDVRLTTPRASFPVSELAVRIDNGEARMAPVTVTLAPHAELVAEGSLERQKGVPRYALSLSAKTMPLKDLMNFGRTIGVGSAQGLDAQGPATVALHLSGSAWPLTRPTLTGHAELREARLLVAGLTKPLNVARARIRFNGDHVIADPVVAVMDSTVFSGQLERRGDRREPWVFDLRANRLSLEQGALWFDVLGLRRPVPLLESLLGLRSLVARRVAASNLFGALNAQGHFAVPTVTYRAMTLKDVRATVEVSARRIRMTSVRFRAAEGRGQGTIQLDLNSSPARVTGEVELARANVRPLAVLLPGNLQGVKGMVSGVGRFETRGLTRQEMSAGLAGKATLRLEKVYFGRFDPLELLVREAGAGSLEPARGEVGLRPAVVALEVHDRRVVGKDCSLDLAGTKMTLSGSYTFDRTLDLDVRADLRHLRRHWIDRDPENSPSRELLNLHLAGPLDKLAVVPERQAFARRSVR